MTTYSLYGITVESAYPFQTQLVKSNAHTAHFRFRSYVGNGLMHAYTGARLLYSEQGAEYRVKDKTSYLTFPDVEYVVTTDEITAICKDESKRHLVEIGFLNTIMPFWLESHGVLVFHGAVISRDGAATAILSGQGTGKSTIAAKMLLNGYHLLSDELAVLAKVNGSWYAYPGYAEFHLWPDAHRMVFGSEPHVSRTRVVPDKEKRRYTACDGFYFGRDPVPLHDIVILSSTDQQLTGYKAIRALHRSSSMPAMAKVTGHEHERMHKLWMLAQDVPTRTVAYVLKLSVSA